MIRVTRNGDIILIKRDEVAVIRYGLNIIEEEAGIKQGKRPSLLRREGNYLSSLSGS